MTFPMPILSPYFPPVEAAFIANVVNNVSSSTPTFTGANIGTASADRFVVLFSQHGTDGGTKTITGCTIGGNAATELIPYQQSNNGPGNYVYGCFGLLVPAGSTANIVYTLNASATNNNVAIFTLKKLRSLTVFDYGVDLTQSTSHSTTVDTAAGGAVLAAYSQRTDAFNASTWTNVTEQFDDDNGNYQMSGAMNTTALANGTLNVQQSMSAGSTSRQCLMALSMR